MGRAPEATAAGRLPNVEDPPHLLPRETLVVGDWMNGPRGPPVASTGWLAHNYFPRSAQFGIPPLLYAQERISPDSFLEVKRGWASRETVVRDGLIPARVDIRAVQSSALGMRAPQWQPGQPVELTNLHPRNA